MLTVFASFLHRRPGVPSPGVVALAASIHLVPPPNSDRHFGAMRMPKYIQSVRAWGIILFLPCLVAFVLYGEKVVPAEYRLVALLGFIGSYSAIFYVALRVSRSR